MVLVKEVGLSRDRDFGGDPIGASPAARSESYDNVRIVEAAKACCRHQGIFSVFGPRELGLRLGYN